MLLFRAFMLLQSSHYKWHMDNFDIENIIHILEIIIPIWLMVKELEGWSLFLG